MGGAGCYAKRQAARAAKRAAPLEPSGPALAAAGFAASGFVAAPSVPAACAAMAQAAALSPPVAAEPALKRFKASDAGPPNATWWWPSYELQEAGGAEWQRPEAVASAVRHTASVHGTVQAAIPFQAAGGVVVYYATEAEASAAVRRGFARSSAHGLWHVERLADSFYLKLTKPKEAEAAAAALAEARGDAERQAKLLEAQDSAVRAAIALDLGQSDRRRVLLKFRGAIDRGRVDAAVVQLADDLRLRVLPGWQVRVLSAVYAEVFAEFDGVVSRLVTLAATVGAGCTINIVARAPPKDVSVKAHRK
jgi:hypothetical protein